MNWKNTAENLLLVLIGVVAGVFIGYAVSVKTAERMLEQQKSLIEKAINKETIKNEIKNEIKIDKIKKSDSISIVLSPENNQKPINVISKEIDTSGAEEKKGFFKRLFGKRKK